MKIIPVLALALATSACTAQQSSITAAFDIFVSCVSGATLAAGTARTKEKAIIQTADINAACTDWTYTWLPAFTNEPLNEEETLRFVKYKNQLMKIYYAETLKTIR